MTTISKLIEHLKQFPGDLEVYKLADESCTYFELKLEDVKPMEVFEDEKGKLRPNWWEEDVKCITVLEI